MSTALSGARRRVAECLKVHGPAEPARIAERLDLTPVAVRQHLHGLAAAGLATSAPIPAEGRGRPPGVWELTPRAMDLFPDRHGELTVGLLDAIRSTVGEEGLERVLDARGAAQIEQYAAILPSGDLEARVAALAEQRTREGYMAETKVDEDGSLLLIEHHCAICEAATSCLGLCRVELDVFREVLGPAVSVERVSHLLSGDLRCVYRVTVR